MLAVNSRTRLIFTVSGVVVCEDSKPTVIPQDGERVVLDGMVYFVKEVITELTSDSTTVNVILYSSSGS